MLSKHFLGCPYNIKRDEDNPVKRSYNMSNLPF